MHDLSSRLAARLKTYSNQADLTKRWWARLVWYSPQVHLCLCAWEAQLRSPATALSILSFLRVLLGIFCPRHCCWNMVNSKPWCPSLTSFGCPPSSNAELRSHEPSSYRRSSCQKRKSIGGPTARRHWQFYSESYSQSPGRMHRNPVGRWLMIGLFPMFDCPSLPTHVTVLPRYLCHWRCQVKSSIW